MSENGGNSQPEYKIIRNPDGTFSCPVCGFTARHTGPVASHIYIVHMGGKPRKKKKKKKNQIQPNEFVPQTNNQEERRGNGNGVPILPVHAEDYMPDSVPNYYNRDKILELLDAHLENGIPILLTGPKGEGKTLSIAYFAAKKKIPIIQFDCSENTKRYDLIGRFVLKGNDVFYLLGVLPTAIEVANQYGAAILVLEEINSLTPQMQKVLNQILDWRKHVYVPEIGVTFKLRDGAKLLICATRNPSTYGGVFELNEDLKSRFVEVLVDYPNQLEQIKILETVTGFDDRDFLKKLSLLALETRTAVEDGTLTYALSTRDLVQFVNVYKSYKGRFNDKIALGMALKVVVMCNYVDKTEKRTVEERIKSIFGEVL